MKNKTRIVNLILVLLIVIGSVFAVNLSLSPRQHAIATDTADNVAVKTVASQIIADGMVTAQDQAQIHFQTGGKLVSLPFKEGDKVREGQTIAQLDTYQLQRQLTAALNTYRSTRDTFDQTQQYNSVGAEEKIQRTALNNAGAPLEGNDSARVINDTVKRVVDQNQANLDNSVVNVELANYALQLSTLSSPFSGIITHEDVTVPNQNITPATTFTLIDPSTLIFRTSINENDIDFVQEGAVAAIQLNGYTRSLITGTVSKIYPEKQTLSNGQRVYQIDISAPAITSFGKLDQTGVVTITSSTGQNVMLVPSWLVLNHQYIWVSENGQIVLKTIVLGKTHGNQIEVLSGLKPEDQLIINPASIAKSHYTVL